MTEHTCRPGARRYFCPASSEIESDCHGGFGQCCARPDQHQPVLPCSTATLRHRPHGPHSYEPQPGMNPVHCPGGDGADRPALEDLDAVPEPARWCCAGNAEDCPLCTDPNPDYPWICPGHPDTPTNRARVQAARGDQTLDGLRQHAADVAQRTGLAVSVDPFHDQYAVTVTRPDGGGSHGGYNAAEVRAMLLGIRLAADRGPTARPAFTPAAAAALARVEQLAARIEAGHPVQNNPANLAAAIRQAARTDQPKEQ